MTRQLTTDLTIFSSSSMLSPKVKYSNENHGIIRLDDTKYKRGSIASLSVYLKKENFGDVAFKNNLFLNIRFTYIQIRSNGSYMNLFYTKCLARARYFFKYKHALKCFTRNCKKKFFLLLTL